MDIPQINREFGACLDLCDADKLRELCEKYRDLLQQIYIGDSRRLDYCIKSIFMHNRDKSDTVAMDMIRVLLDYGADINASSYIQSKVGAIVDAAERGPELVRFFLDSGAILNHDLFGRPACWPLISAVCAGRLDTVKFLVERGAVVNFVNIHRMSPLDYALNNPKRTHIADYLLSIDAKRGSEIPQDHIPPDEPEEEFVPSSLREHLDSIPEVIEGVEEFPLHEIVAGDPPLQFLKAEWSGGCVGIFTDGLSANPMNPPTDGTDGVTRAELAILLPCDWPLDPESLKEARYRWPFDWLRAIARIPFTDGGYLRRITIIANGDPPQPLSDRTEMTCLLVRSWPEAWGRWTRPDGEVVELMTISGLYTEERDYEWKHGLEAFESLFDREDPEGWWSRRLSQRIVPDRPLFTGVTSSVE